MKNKTVLSQFVNMVPIYDFQRCVDHYKGDYRTRYFKCWDQFVSMVFAQLSGRDSLRDIAYGLNTHHSRHYHLGIGKVTKSTLADANELRDYNIYEDIARGLILRAQRAYANTPLLVKIEGSIYALDASTVDLCLSLFDWAKFREAKGAVKLHTMIDLRGNIPVFLHITDGKTHEINVARTVPIEEGSIIVIDRGYIDFEWLYNIESIKAFFVIRSKSNTQLKRLCSRKKEKNKGIICDQEVHLSSLKGRLLYPKRLRRIRFKDLDTGKTLVFLTNQMTMPAETIAAIYKCRWQVELFFKWIKQHLKIKTFYGTSPNAVKTQIWIAMIVYLIIVILKERFQLKESLNQILQILSVNLFEERPILSLFQKVERTKLKPAVSEQLNLFDP